MRLTNRQARDLGLRVPATASAGAGRPKRRAKERTAPGRAPGAFAGRLLAIDPSSTAVGWAEFAGGRLLRVGVERSGADDPRRRIDRLIADIRAVAGPFNPDRIVMETCSGMHRRARSLSVATLAFAQGALWWELSRDWPTACVPENDWTRGTPKATRARRVAAMEPTYHQFMPRDKGLDGADAVGLGHFYLANGARP